jgi:hypothetical protein
MRSSSPLDCTTLLLSLCTIPIGIVALLAPSPVKPNDAGYQECIKLHPERFCRIKNGYPVPVLAKAP